jgi:excinuclease UvrABC nuclease subunit
MSFWKTIDPARLLNKREPSLQELLQQAGQRVPKAPGVYAIFKHGRLVYIGQSEILRNRIAAHIEALNAAPGSRPGSAVCGIGFAGVLIKYKVCKQPGEWLSLEYRLIKRLKPKYNTQFKEKEKLSKKKIGKNRTWWNSSLTPLQRFNELLRERQQAKEKRGKSAA